jgi:hypothetical protein
MKIREFFNVKGFDPKKCGTTMYFNYDKYEDKVCPVCPIAHALSLRMELDKYQHFDWVNPFPHNPTCKTEDLTFSDIKIDILDQFIPNSVRHRFTITWDTSRNFTKALEAAELEEEGFAKERISDPCGS